MKHSMDALEEGQGLGFRAVTANRRRAGALPIATSVSGLVVGAGGTYVTRRATGRGPMPFGWVGCRMFCLRCDGRPLGAS